MLNRQQAITWISDGQDLLMPYDKSQLPMHLFNNNFSLQVPASVVLCSRDFKSTIHLYCGLYFPAGANTRNQTNVNHAKYHLTTGSRAPDLLKWKSFFGPFSMVSFWIITGWRSTISLTLSNVHPKLKSDWKHTDNKNITTPSSLALFPLKQQIEVSTFHSIL